jgi:hypothetical protein
MLRVANNLLETQTDSQGKTKKKVSQNGGTAGSATKRRKEKKTKQKRKKRKRSDAGSDL